MIKKYLDFILELKKEDLKGSYLLNDYETNLELENKQLKEENDKLKQQLENYNNSRKSYYEKNKEVVKKKANARKQKLAAENPEKIKEYAKRAYLKQKEKKSKFVEENN